MKRLALLLAIFILIAIRTTAMAGENVIIRDATGHKLRPSQISGVNFQKTCGDCHDVRAKAESIHFDRASGGHDPESGACLSCHLSSHKPFNSRGEIRRADVVSSNSACLNCHADILKSTHQGTAHAHVNCINCHRGAGHVAARTPTCADCHISGKAPRPRHEGLTRKHLELISCEGCHISTGVSRLRILKGRIMPINSESRSLHIGVGKAGSAYGARSCTQCHSSDSKFFVGQLDPRRETIREQLIKPGALVIFLIILLICAMHYIIFGPKRVKSIDRESDVIRFAAIERLFHLGAAISFSYLAATGVLFMLHLENPSSNLRSLHGHAGVIFVVSVVGLAILWWRNALFVGYDWEWIRNLGGYVRKKGHCPAGKFNAGQKAFFWGILIVGGAAISVTGMILVQSRGQASSLVFTLHDIAAVVFISGLLGHIYLAIFANSGALRGMITGKVKKTWAEWHHPNWQSGRK